MAAEVWICGGCGQEVTETHYRWEKGKAVHGGKPKAGDALDAKWTDAVGEFLKDQGVPIEVPDESPSIPDEAWGPRPDSVEDAEDNLFYTVEAIPDPEPIAPEGVVIHFRSGESQKVELVYAGLDLHGLHIWEVTTHPRFEDVERVSIETMPPMTMIHIGGPGGP